MASGQAEALAREYGRLHRTHRRLSVLGTVLFVGTWGVMGVLFQLRGTKWETVAGVGVCCVGPMAMAVGVWFMIRAYVAYGELREALCWKCRRRAKGETDAQLIFGMVPGTTHRCACCGVDARRVAAQDQGPAPAVGHRPSED